MLIMPTMLNELRDDHAGKAYDHHNQKRKAYHCSNGFSKEIAEGFTLEPFLWRDLLFLVLFSLVVIVHIHDCIVTPVIDRRH